MAFHSFLGPITKSTSFINSFHFPLVLGSTHSRLCPFSLIYILGNSILGNCSLGRVI